MRSDRHAKNLTREKPWARLRMSRRAYETARPKAKAGLSRQKWVELLLFIPDESVDALKLEADAVRRG